MLDKEQISLIVDTYDLDQRVKKKIKRIALSRIAEFGIGSFDEAYRYIADLVEKFKTPFFEKFFLRLDKPLWEGSKKTLLDITGTEEIESMEGEPISFEEVLSNLHLGVSEITLLKDLTQGKPFREFVFNPADLLAKGSLEVHKRLEEIVQTYGKDGRILIPPRPIINIRFDPLKIHFGYRDIGDALQFFRTHKIYEGMGRSELSKFDRGLYMKLLRYNQLDEAIPEKRMPNKYKLSKGQITNLVDTLRKNEGDAYKTIRELQFSMATIRKYARLNGVEIERRRKISYLSEEDIETIISSYDIYLGDPNEAERYLPYKSQTIKRIWENNGFKINTKYRYLGELNKQKIISLHEKYQRNSAEAERNSPYSRRTIARIWREAGLKPSRPSLTENRKREIIDAYKTFDGNVVKAAQHLPYTYELIWYHWIKSGFEINYQRPKKT